MDTRVRVTRTLIEKSFIELLKKMPMRKITVTKICENAQINRVTFYKHYLDVFDLYEKMVAELIESSAAKMTAVFETRNLREAIRIIFQNIYDNAEQYELLFSAKIDNICRMRSMEMCMKRLSDIDIDVPNMDKEQYEWLKKFLSTGGGGVLFAWLQNGMKQNPSEVADTLYDFISRIMVSYSIAI